MKSAVLAFLMVLCTVVITPVMPGCATGATHEGTNALRYSQAEDIYASLARTVITLNDSRAISLEQATEASRLLASANRLLDEWHAAVAAGRPFDRMDSLNSILNEVALLVAQAPRANRVH